MNVEDFFKHHGITENPFGAEEARHDPVFERLLHDGTGHPGFGKILGRIDQPSAAIVFGEKGSGKTAIRLLIGRKVAEHNRAVASGQAGHSGNGQPPPRRTLLVAHDDLNPVLDRFVKQRRRSASVRDGSDAVTERLLGEFRLVDHQDAILSKALTSLTDAVLEESAGGVAANGGDRIELPQPVKQVKSMPRHLRVNLALLAALYDQPADGNVLARWQRLRRRLRLGWMTPIPMAKLFGLLLLVVAIGLAMAHLVMEPGNHPRWLVPALWASAAGGVVLLGMWAWRAVSLWSLARRILRDTPTIDRTPGELQRMLASLRAGDLKHQPWPLAQAGSDARYDLTRRLVEVLRHLGYGSIIVLVDRIDEPTLVAGKPQRMQSIIWPMLDNKFLQQESIALKLLLPLELRYQLQRESGEFFQEARLDKQNLIDRLTWSGATLYDLCSERLRACRRPPPGETEPPPIQLTDLFEEDVNRQMLIDALEQMQQPRDAFKFLHAVVQEHCRIVSADEPEYRIPRLTLETVRRIQAQRVQELHRGLTPA
jgi:hypothetical protein